MRYAWATGGNGTLVVFEDGSFIDSVMADMEIRPDFPIALPTEPHAAIRCMGEILDGSEWELVSFSEVPGDFGEDEATEYVGSDY